MVDQSDIGIVSVLNGLAEGINRGLDARRQRKMDDAKLALKEKSLALQHEETVSRNEQNRLYQEQMIGLRGDELERKTAKDLSDEELAEKALELKEEAEKRLKEKSVADITLGKQLGAAKMKAADASMISAQASKTKAARVGLPKPPDPTRIAAGLAAVNKQIAPLLEEKGELESSLINWRNRSGPRAEAKVRAGEKRIKELEDEIGRHKQTRSALEQMMKNTPQGAKTDFIPSSPEDSAISDIHNAQSEAEAKKIYGAAARSLKNPRAQQRLLKAVQEASRRGWKPLPVLPDLYGLPADITPSEDEEDEE